MAQKAIRMLALLLAAVLMICPAASASAEEIPFHGVAYPADTLELDFAGQCVVAEELRLLLPRLPALENVNLQDTRISPDELMALSQEFPNVSFQWEAEAFGQIIPWDCTELDFSGMKMDGVEPVEALLSRLPKLQRLEMCGCGIDNETMDALNRRHENVQIIWSFPYGKQQIRTDITWFLPFMYSVLGATNDETLANLRYCTELVAVDLGHTNVTDISWVRYTPKLRFLIVGDSPISDLSPLADVSSLVYLEAFQTNVTDYSPLLTCSGLEDLNIGYTYGDPAVVQQMTWLKNLWWHMPWTVHSDYEEDWEYMKAHIGELMPDTTASLLHSDSSTGRGWRDLPNYFAQRDTVHMVYMIG